VAGLTLRDAKELSAPGAPLKEQLFIPAPEIDTWSSGPADAKVPNGDCTYYRLSIFLSMTLLFRSVQDRHRYQPKGSAP
jgi:hypothetical protein